MITSDYCSIPGLMDMYLPPRQIKIVLYLCNPQPRVVVPTQARAEKFTVLASQDQTIPMVRPVSGTWWDPRGTSLLSALPTLLCSPRQVVLQTMWKCENMMLQVQILLLINNNYF